MGLIILLVVLVLLSVEEDSIMVHRTIITAEALAWCC